MERTPDTRFPAAKLAAAMALIGTVGAFAVEAGLDPVTTVFWRCVFGSVFLGAWCVIRGYLPDRSLSPTRLALAALGGVCMVLSWTAFFAGFAMTSIATTTIVIISSISVKPWSRDAGVRAAAAPVVAVVLMVRRDS